MIRFLQGDALDRLSVMPADSIDCVVTSPPYWGLRDYGVEGQLGLEPTLQEHLDSMVRVFSEVYRVLKPKGTLWLNYGDCYATSPNGYLKPKDLCMVPNRIAIALQEWGWWIRSEIIWAKPNPMPESVTDRPAVSHEKIFLLTKSPRYFYDANAVRQNAAQSSLQRCSQNIEAQSGSTRGNGGAKTNGNMKAVGGPKKDKQSGHGRRHAGFNGRWDAMSKEEQQSKGRNLRNYEPAPMQVWGVATRPFKDAHFATFPPELVERCLKAGCPKGGHVLDPFGGSGTTGLVADRMQMDATLIELNPEYIEIAKARIATDQGPLFRQLGETDNSSRPTNHRKGMT